jgi:hypothetical protein
MNPSFSRTVLVMMALLLTVAACNAPKKALNRGDYEQAVRLSVDKLRSNPNNKSARQVLAESWPRAVLLHEERIATFQSSSEPFRWEKVVGSYEQLNAMTTMLQRCPACESVVPSYKLYVDEVGDARRRAAQARYDAGIASLDPNSRERSRTAYEHFMVVERMMPDYRDTRARMTEALNYATLHVIVSVPPIQSRSLALSHEFFHNKVMEYLQTNRRMNDFVRFYYPDEAANEGMDRPDHDVFLQFDDFVVGQTLVESHTETITSRDSVKVGQSRMPDGTMVDVFNRVEAKFTRFKKTVVSRGLMDMQIVDSHNGRVILQEKIPGEFVWIAEWATFNGDERALNPAQRQLAQRREVPSPAPQDLFIMFTGPIYDQVTDRLRRFYNR